jgi:hypothetical protein
MAIKLDSRRTGGWVRNHYSSNFLLFIILLEGKNQTVTDVLSTTPLNISFRRTLVGDKLQLWHELVSKVLNIVANDSFKWILTKNSEFTVRSMYKDLMQTDRVPNRSIAWKLKVTLKIKVFLWYLQKGVILTKDNLLKRRWQGGSQCCFYLEDETIQHLFFDCHVAKFVVWNAIFFTFGIKPPTSVVDMLGSWLGCFSQKLRKQVWLGAAAMCWAIWLCRNDAVFNRRQPNSFCRLSSGERTGEGFDHSLLKRKRNMMEGLVLELFARRGWNFRSRITY